METTPWYKASWWSAALYVVFVLANHFFGLGLEVGSVIALVIPIIAIIFGDRWVEVAKLRVEALKLEIRLMELKMKS